MGEELKNVSLYDISFDTSQGDIIRLSDYRGKVVMVVNTASKCGFTPQYAALELVWQKYKDKGFIVIAVPSNDFMGQEPGTNEEIAKFCQLNFGVTFPITAKVKTRGKEAHPFFQLTKKEFGTLSGPLWNFYKYLFDANGKPIEWFSSKTLPDSEGIINAIEKNLVGIQPIDH